MTEAVKILTLIDIIFILLLGISGSIGGVVGEILYGYVVFIIPLLIGFYASLRLKAKREAEAGVAEKLPSLFTLDTKSVKALLPLVAPLVTVVFSVSLLTALVLSWFGVTTPTVEDRNVLWMLFDHALTPAIFEEIVFRYVLILLIAPYSKRVCVFYSAFCFALIHCSFSQMPYAFVAGVIFMAVDLAFGSIWPSVVLHFINNAASVLMMKYCHTTPATLIFVGALLVLSAVSAYVIYKKRSEYAELVYCALEKGQSAQYGYPAFILVLLCGYIAVSNLFV